MFYTRILDVLKQDIRYLYLWMLLVVSFTSLGKISVKVGMVQCDMQWYQQKTNRKEAR